MAIYSGFTHWKWWFSIVMLVYQRVVLARVSSGYSLISPVPWPPVASFPWRVPGRRSTGFWWHPTIHLVSCGAVFGQYETTEITWVCVKINEHHLQMSKKSFHLLVNHHSPYIFMSSNGVFWFHGYFSRPSSRNVPSQGCRQVTNIPHGSIMLYDSFVDHRAVEHRGEEDRWTITGGR